jgi:hypothetical protein
MYDLISRHFSTQLREIPVIVFWLVGHSSLINLPETRVSINVSSHFHVQQHQLSSKCPLFHCIVQHTYKLLSLESFLAPFTFRQVSLSGLRDSIWLLLSAIRKSFGKGIILLPFVERCHLSLASDKQARWISSFQQKSVTKSFVPAYWFIVIHQILSSVTPFLHFGGLHLFSLADSCCMSHVSSYRLVVICATLSLFHP